MGNALGMLDWPSAGQLAACAGCGAAAAGALGGRGAGAGAALALALALALAEAAWGRVARRRVPGAGRGVVALTGCDSGIGFSLAAHSLRMGLRVVAGCLHPHGPGARRLRQTAPHGGATLTVLPLDVTSAESVADFCRGVERLLEEDKERQLLALVNNAGVMVFGEFAWQTERQIEQQIQVNLCGPLRVTLALCGVLRAHAARVVTVSSHCALEALPGLAPYAATKAALEAWSAALRVEQAPHGVRVVTLVPGSFSTSSNIMARHEENAQEMEKQLRQERPREWDYYEGYFRAFHRYLQVISGDKGVKEIDDPRLYFKYECCLLALWPKQQYVNAPVRYNLYHAAMRLAPRCVRDHLVRAFVHLPPFQGKAANTKRD